MTTHAFDRQAPLGEAERALLRGYLDEVVGRVAPHLEAALLEELRGLVVDARPALAPVLGESAHRAQPLTVERRGP